MKEAALAPRLPAVRTIAHLWMGIFAFVGLLAPVSRAAAQCTNDWHSDIALSSLNGAAYAATTWDPDGPGPLAPQLIVGGSFSNAGATPVANIAAWNGTAWQPLDGGVNDDVLALTSFAGRLVAAGRFTTAGGISSPGVASWNGTTWQPLDLGVNGVVASLTVHDSNLIVGGLFTIAGSVTANNIARWNGVAWQALGSGIGGSFPYVQALASYAGNVVAGGLFTTAGGTPINCLAQWNGSTWQSIGTGIPGFGYIDAMTIYNNTLIVGGQFPDAGGADAHNIAQWNGTSWNNMGGRHMNSVPLALTVYNGELIVGGNFIRLPDASDANRIARWNGTTWQPLGVGTDTDVLALTLFEGYLIAGGSFFSAGGLLAPHTAQWGPAPAIVTTQPAGQLVCVGDPASFEVAASGVAPLAYQWRRGTSILTNAGAIAGADSSVLNINPVTAADAAANYNCVVTDACGGRTISHLATLTVTAGPSADTGGPYETCESTPVIVTGLASHTNSVSWQSNGTGTFADAESLNTEYTPSIDDVAAGSVTITLTAQPIAPCALAASATTTLTIRKSPTAGAGGPYVVCADAPGVAINGSAADQSAVAWSSSGDGNFTDAANLITSYAPGPADLAAGSVTLTLTALPAAPCATAATDIASLSITPAPLGDPGGPYVTCNTTPVPLNGAINGAVSAHWSSSGTGTFDNANNLAAIYTPSVEDAAAGSVQLTLTANPVSPCTASTTTNVTLEIHTNPQILIQPISPAIGVGGDITLSVSAMGGGLTYQWKKDTFPIEGATDATYSIKAAEPTDAGTYTCVVSNDCGSITTNPTVLVVNHHATLALGLPSACSAGEQLVVSINVSAATSIVVGGQFFLSYDTNVLQLASATPGDAPFLRQIYLASSPTLGTIDFAVGINDGETGTTAPVTMARFTFNVLADLCTPTPNLVSWRPSGPDDAISKLSNDLAEPVLATTVDLASVRIDRVPPQLAACPSNLAVECPSEIPPPASVTANDSCDGAIVPALSESTEPGPCPNAYTLTRTWTATDACGNLASCAQLITVNDTTAPVIGSSPPIAAIYASQSAAENAASAAALMATSDNCTGQLTPSASTVGDCTATITVTVADACGNVSNSVQFETQIDESAPTILTCPADILTNVDSANCTAIVNWAAPTASDNCVEPTITRTAGPPPGSVFANGSATTIEYTAADAAGNTATCTFTVTVAASPDLNNDNVVDALDIPLFVDVLLGLDPTPWRIARADTNCDGAINGTDIQPFLSLSFP